MFKKILSGLLLVCAAMSPVWAGIDVNVADQAQLESIKGVGPAKAKAILEERAKNGPFKDSADLSARVKGLGEKSVAKLQADGLIIGANVGKTAVSNIEKNRN